MNNGMTNLVIGTSSREDGVLVTHLVRGVEFGKILVTYENGRPTRIDRTESMKVEAAGGNVARLV